MYKEDNVQNERRFSAKGPRYFYEGTAKTKAYGDKEISKLKKRGFRTLLKKSKGGYRVYRAAAQ